MPREVTIEDGFDSWARVELYRWQHGHLPGDPTRKKPSDPPGPEKPLDEAAGLRAMADALELGCEKQDVKLMPSPFNIATVLRYVAKKMPTLTIIEEALQPYVGRKITKQLRGTAVPYSPTQRCTPSGFLVVIPDEDYDLNLIFDVCRGKGHPVLFEDNPYEVVQVSIGTEQGRSQRRVFLRNISQ